MTASSCWRGDDSLDTWAWPRTRIVSAAAVWPIVAEPVAPEEGHSARTQNVAAAAAWPKAWPARVLARPKVAPAVLDVAGPPVFAWTWSLEAHRQVGKTNRHLARVAALHHRWKNAATETWFAEWQQGLEWEHAGPT